jgi:hypothetical protein
MFCDILRYTSLPWFNFNPIRQVPKQKPEFVGAGEVTFPAKTVRCAEGGGDEKTVGGSCASWHREIVVD